MRKPELLVYEQILGQLAKLEEEQKNYAASGRVSQELKDVSPSKPYIENGLVS